MPDWSAKGRNELPLHCNHWGTYRVAVSDGNIRSLIPFEEDPDPSSIGQGIVGTLDHELRITQPMFRRGWLDNGPGASGSRGSDGFVQLPWHKAIPLVATELTRISREYGNEAIYGGSYGWASAGRFHNAQNQLKRFLNCLGGFTRSVNSYSFAAAEVVMPHIMGSFLKLLDETTSWPVIADHCQLFVGFGGVPQKNGQANPGGTMTHCQRDGISAATKNGVKFINISPMRTDMPLDMDVEWISPRPGTDVALMLAIAHTLVKENLHDQQFLDEKTVGFERFRQYLFGNADGVVKSAAWASAICGLTTDQICALAKRMAAARTMISISWSMSRQHHGEQPFWAAVTLAAMIGQLGLPGGGIGFGYGAVNSVGDDFTIIPAASLPQGENRIDSFIPVARISDMLMHPGDVFDFDGKQYTYPDIRLVYWAGGNPFHHHQDLFRLKEAWQRPETIICHEWVWNSLARHADIVLPCTTSLEREDIAVSRSAHLIYNSKIIEPKVGWMNDHEIFCSIAKFMGLDEQFSGGRSQHEWLTWIYSETRQRMARQGIELPEYDEFRAKGWHKVENPPNPRIFLGDFRKDPYNFPLETPSGKIEIFSDEVAQFGYADCPGHAAWFEPVEWLGNDKRKHPLHMISNQPATKLHSQLDHGQVSMASKIDGREQVVINSVDAKPRDIANGDLVRIFNERGACLAVAAVDDKIMPGVLQMSTGAWFDPVDSNEHTQLCRHGNPNALTIDKGTSRLAQGPIAHTCLVDIERFRGNAPNISVRSAPMITVQM